MADSLMTEAGLDFPVLGFPCDDDVFPFEHLALLFGKSLWWAERGRLDGMEIVDSAGRRWKAAGVVQRAPTKKRWWQFGGTAEPEHDIELQPLDPESFASTRQRVEALAGQIFPGDDEALADVRSATDMAELAGACFQITVRAQAMRILAGRPAVPIRSVDAVVDRALISFALVRISLGVDRIDVMEWLDAQGLVEALRPSEPPFFTSVRLSDQQKAEAGWSVEGLVALLWALGFSDLPPTGDHPDLSTIISIVPPAGDMDVESFRRSARLRPAHDLAVMAEHCRIRLSEAERDYEAVPSDDTANVADGLRRRYFAIQWILNPDRLEWP